MSPPWSRPLDVDRLADREAEIECDLALAELPRLRSRVPSIGGTVRARVRFGRESRFAVADISLQGEATLVCQRCLGPMTEPLRSNSRVALIAAESDASRVPEHLEPVLAAGGRISIGELVEEELLLALPIVALHARTADCDPVPAAPAPGSTPEEHVVQRPFEQLGGLLKKE